MAQLSLPLKKNKIIRLHDQKDKIPVETITLSKSTFYRHNQINKASTFDINLLTKIPALN